MLLEIDHWQGYFNSAILLSMIGLYDILQASNGQLFGEPAAHLFTGFCIDPADAGESLLYVALKTDTGDTHRHIGEAIAQGVSGVMCVEPPDIDTSGVSVILVNDPVEALMEWARFTIGKLGIKVIAVAGSSSKSVTLEAVSTVLETKYNIHSFNTDIEGRLGIPLSIASLRVGHEFAVLKLPAQHPGEMAAMVETVRPAVGIITNIDCVHTDEFDNCGQLVREFGELLEYLSPDGLAVLNYDDDQARTLLTRTRANLQTIGIDRFGADWMAYNVLNGLTGTGFDLRHSDDRYVGRWSPLLGKYHLYSVLCSVAVGQHFEIDVDTALDALTELKPLSGRMMPLTGVNKSLLVDDTYRANPISAKGALQWLDSVKAEGQRTIFVLGDLDDIGKNRRVGHRLIGEQVADVADVFITQGAGAALAGRSAMDHGMPESNIHMVYSAQDTAEVLSRLSLRDTDVVLVKGGAAQRMEQVIESLVADRDQDRLLVRSRQAEDAVAAKRPMRPSWVEIDTSAVSHNVRWIKDKVGDNTELMAIVKADAYGHGAVAVARTALMNGATYLAVASVAEALTLRDAGIDAPILVLSYTPIQAVRQAVLQQITVNVYDLEMARTFDRVSREVEGSMKLKVHMKVDSGMGRLGIFPDEAVTMARHMSTMNDLELEGVYTHFATADDDIEYANQQLDTFKSVVRALRAAGIRFKFTHAANSAGILNMPDSYFNMVRGGIMLYGLSPTNEVNQPPELLPAMTWKTVVAQVREFLPNHPIGYGNTYYTQEEEIIAILPVGYADGLRRTPKTWKEVLIHGQRAPIVGRVSMEKCAVNVTHIPDVSIGDEVVLLGNQGDERISAEEVAGWLDTNNYEIVTSILPRVPR